MGISSVVVRLRRAVTVIAVAVVAVASTAPVVATAADWPTYHRSNLRDGNDTAAAPFKAIGQQWISPVLDGDVYAEPLVVGNQVIVATENNSLYSLDATTGLPTWGPVNFGTPVTVSGNGAFGGCGNVSPDGITGTPVVDPVMGVVYAAAFVHTASSDSYELVAVNLADGSQKFAPIPIAPTGFDVYRQQQRAALALANGMVYVPFGGYGGDCRVYHGWVIGIKSDGSSAALTVFNDQPAAPCPAATSASDAGIWAASGAAVDASGSVYVATGNGSDTSTYDCGETVFKLSGSTLGYVDSWAPTHWATLNGNDDDIGSIGPLVVGPSGNLIFQSGKNGWGYLLNTAKLSANVNHIGGEAFSAAVCDAALASPSDETAANDQVFGGAAYADPYVYVPCPEGIKSLTLSGSSFTATAGWTTVGFSAGAPIVSGGVLWSVATGGTTLHGLDPVTGASLFTATVGGQSHFSTPAAGQGRIYVADVSARTIRCFGEGGGQYHPLVPARIYDSRNGAGALGRQSSRDLQVTGLKGVPGSGVAAVVVNVTVTNGTAPSYLTVYPTGTARPLASNLNWTAGHTVANLVEVAIGSNGRITVFNAAGSADVIVDVAGYVNIPTGAPTPDGFYNPVVPQRILDTRSGIGGVSQKVGPGQTITIQVTGQGNIPGARVEAVILNVTVTNPTAPSYLTVFPAGGTPPLASNLNYVAGQTTPNRVAVQIGTGGKVSFFNAAGSADVIADTSGSFTDTTSLGMGSTFVAITPTRLLDTRDGTGGFASPVGPNQFIAVPMAGHGGIPAMNAAIPPKALVLNVTVTSPTSPSFLTAWPDGVTRPFASDLNYVAGQTVPNLVVVQIGANGKVDLYNAAGSTDVIADVMGWYG